MGPVSPGSLTIPLADIADRDASETGPKAAALGRLLRAGLPVPPGFCILARAYRERLPEGLAGRIRSVLDRPHPDGEGDLPEALAEIRGAIRMVPISGDLREEIGLRLGALGAPPVAVRSSATAEDRPGHSFAGQYDTFLGVTGLEACLDRVAACWASLWTDRAFAYRRQNGIGHLDAAMAVIVQAMAPAEAAGVMFTADPVGGRRDCAILEASLGLGGTVVAGKVRPDRIVVSKRVFQVERRSTASKTVEMVPGGPDGVLEREVPADRASRPCLDDTSARRLTLLGAEIESLMGGPQDVEWAIAGGEPRILQARPITALPPPPERPLEDRQIWTNANLREVAPDPVSPMTWSWIEEMAPPLFGPIFGLLGIDIDPYQIAGLVAGRVYFNVNGLAAVARALFAGSRLDTGAVFGDPGQAGGVRTALRIPPEDLPRLRLRRWRLLYTLPWLLGWLLLNPLRRAPSMLDRLRTGIAAMARERPESLGDEALLRRIGSYDRIAREDLLENGKVPLAVIGGLIHVILAISLCRRWLGGDPGLAHRLLAGLGGLEDAEAGIGLWRLADLARRAPELEAAVRDEATFSGVARRAAGTAAGESFLRAWSEFLEEHGHHCRGEFELLNPRWVEEPDRILGLVRGHLGGIGRVDPVARARRLAEERESLARDCARRLRNPIRRRIFAVVLRRAQEGLRFRETLKSRTIDYLAIARRQFLDLGERFVRRGILDRREDIFFLRREELAPVLKGDLDPGPVVASRRAEHERDAALDPPPIVFGRFDPRTSAPPVLDERIRELAGIGVSHGKATGKARVILHPDAGQVSPGEVLVAPFTDPSWAPYFVNAAAIVMDQGGLLSHGSIIAREYGIPCVVNVGPATRRIRDGQTIEVDGDRGAVRILDGPPFTSP
jgi:phosphohistidine swiveling domain-containing protein